MPTERDSQYFESEAEHDRASNSTAPASGCTHQGQQYSKGSIICINGDQYQCGNSGWFKNGKKC